MVRNRILCQFALAYPRCSVLRPILFPIYINDLPDTITSKERLFADDAALYLTIVGDKDSTTLQHDLDKLSVWEREWDMDFNPSKCQEIQVTGSRKPIIANYSLHGHVLETVACARYFGVDISSGLSWRSHIDRVTGSATKPLNFVRRNVKTKHPGEREMAYSTLSLVRPKLEYAAAVCDPHTKGKTKQDLKLSRLQ